MFNPTAFQQAVIANTAATTAFPTADATASSTSATTTTDTAAAKYGSTAGEFANTKQLLYTATTVVGGDESSGSISTASATAATAGTSYSSNSGQPTTTAAATATSIVSRFTVTLVEETEESLIGQLSRVHSDDDDESNQIGTPATAIEVAIATTKCSSTSSCTSSSTISSSTTTSLSSSCSTVNPQSEDLRYKLYRKHKPSVQYQEYKV